MVIETGKVSVGVSQRGHRSALRFAFLLVVAVTATGCATHRRTTLDDRFVRQGEPSIDVGGPVPALDTSAYVAQLRKLAAEARPRAKAQTQEVAEVRDPRLRDRLAALRAAPSATAHREVAAEYGRLGVLDAAYSHLSAAIRLSPRDAALFDARARMWRAWSLPGLGLPDARKAVALAPQSATAWNTLGLLLEGSGSVEQAVKVYLRAARLDDRAGYAWNNLCRAWTQRGDAPSALQACRRALSLDPSLPFAAINLHTAERMLATAGPSGGPVLNRSQPSGDVPRRLATKGRG